MFNFFKSKKFTSKKFTAKLPNLRATPNSALHLAGYAAFLIAPVFLHSAAAHAASAQNYMQMAQSIPNGGARGAGGGVGGNGEAGSDPYGSDKSPSADRANMNSDSSSSSMHRHRNSDAMKNTTSGAYNEPTATGPKPIPPENTEGHMPGSR
jgi:hypothetical protein